MAEPTNDESTPGAGCPRWCTRQHRPEDHPEDLLHQSAPAYVATVVGRPWLGADAVARATTLVARLVREPRESQTWVEVVGEEEAHLAVSLTAESARRLVTALGGLLALADE